MKLYERAQIVETREEFVEFTRAFYDDYRRGGKDWENTDLESFFEALAACADDMCGYYENRGEPVPTQPTWKTFVNLLMCARIYD